MARRAGRSGRVYIAIASGGSAEPLPFVATWSLEGDTDRHEVTAMGDTNKVYVAGLPDASGQFSGFFDDETQQTWTAAQDGEPRKFYLYPNTGVTTKYWHGTVYPDMSVESDVNGTINWSSSWSAASPILRVG